MGLVLRVDSYPTAVAIPPLQQGIRPTPPIIEAQRIVEPTNTLRSNTGRNHLLQRSEAFATASNAALTYSAKGLAHSTGQLEGGRLLDTYA